MTFIVILLVVSGGLAFVVTSSDQRNTYLSIAIDAVSRLKVAATEPGQEHDLFYEALRARMSYVLVTTAIAVISATVLIGMWFGTGAIGDPATLLSWGASLGTLTTNGGWWRLVTSTFVHISVMHLVVGVAALIQVGRILERVVGRLTVAAVYLSAGVFTGLVNLSSHPLAVTVGASGAVFGLYGLLIALLLWQTFHEWRGTWHTQADADTTVSQAKAGAAPHVLDTLQLQLDRPQLDTWSPAGVGPADHLRQNYDGPPKRHVKAEAGLPPLDASWGLVDETPEPAIETWSPPVVRPSAETWDPAAAASSPAIEPWGPAANTWVPALAGPATTTTVPLVAMKRIGAGAAVFLVYSMLGGFAGAAELTGLLVGLMYGLVLARRAGEQEPTRRQIGFVTAAAGVVVVACAVMLRNIADVKPEIARVLATEERTAASYRAGSEGFKRGRMTAEALAQLAERTIIPELQAADARLKALSNVPPEHQPLVADAREYLRLRCASWRAHADALRKTRGVPERAAGEATDGSWRLQAEAFPEALVIFLAGILHHFPIGPQREGPRGLPGPGERLAVLDDHFVRDVTEVGAREALHEVQLIAVRMTNRIQAGPAVEVDRVDHQRVAFPMTHGVAEPGGDAFAMRTAVDRRHREPGVLFEEKSKVGIALHDLHRLRCVDGAGHAEREAGAGVVAVRRVVLLPACLSPRRERQVRGAFEILPVLRQIRSVRLLPDAAEIDFA